MKIVLTGGGTGGHFFPLIAVAQELNNIMETEKIANARIYFFSDKKYDAVALYENQIQYRYIPAGKLRLYASLKTIPDVIKTGWGILVALFKLFAVYPDVVFGKGGYASFPTLVAARILRIPIVIHESDSVPGRVNAYVGKFAKRVALSFYEAKEYFPKSDVAHTGQPIRVELAHPVHDGAREYLKLEPQTPVIFIVGGSQGSQIINDTVLEALPELLEKYQVIHQVGPANIKEVEQHVETFLSNHPNKERYRLYDFLNPLALRMTAGVADIVVSRAGSMIFEIAAWKIPAILIPITKSNNDHQRKNAYNYARSGAAVVMEEKNLTPHVLISEIDRIVENENIKTGMQQAAEKFYKPDAAKTIAEEIARIALAHEQ